MIQRLSKFQCVSNLSKLKRLPSLSKNILSTGCTQTSPQKLGISLDSKQDKEQFNYQS